MQQLPPPPPLPKLSNLDCVVPTFPNVFTNDDVAN